MGTYVVTAHYCTWVGNAAACRRTVQAHSHSHALDLVAARVRRFKRFMGKLYMDCVRIAD